MGNCIAVRETSDKNPKSTPTYIDINNFIEHHKQLAQMAIEERKKKLEKQIQRVQNGGYGSSEEEDQVCIENMHEGDSGMQQLSDAQKSMIKDSIHSQNNKMSRQQTINSDTSVIQLQEKIKIQNEKIENHSDSDVYNYNSEDELEHFFGGTKSSKKQIKAKNILSSLINQGEKPPNEQIKTFKNTLFKKDDSEEQPVGNVFSDNDASFDDKSPEFKKK